MFVEKPLAVDPDQLQAILAAVADSGNDRLMVGFNRRFAPLLVDLKAAFGARSGPVQVRYDVNAGRLEAGSWYAQPEEGSRLVGEGCHFVDTISWWLDQDPVAVFAAATGDPDDTASTLLYPDGSVATIAYQTGGDPRAPKELFQVTGDGQVARLHNFQRTELWRGGRRQVRRSRTGIDKGQKQELDAFVRAVAEARAMPIPLESLVATTLATFAARRSLASRRLEAVAGDGSARLGSGPATMEACRREPWVVCPAAGQHVASGDGRAGPRRADQAPLAGPAGHRRRRRPGRHAGRCPAFAARLPPGGDDVPEEARVRLKEAAEGLLGGRWPVFGRERDDMAPAPDWFLDPSTGRRAPDRTYCFDIDHRDPAAVGNVKYVWEPSRHQHLTVLAAAYHLDGDERYAEAVATQLRSWWAANPFLSGIHWTSGIELGVRLLSWVWIRRLLDGWPGAGPLFEGNRVFLQQLHHHQEWLARLPSHGSSANNHLLAEMAGQFAAGCAFPWFPESTAWRETAAATLRRELARQTFACGLNRELATEYHGFVLELGFAAALEGELAGHRLGGQVWDTLRRMTDALAAVVDVRLRPPRQGDGDDGHGLLLDGPGYDRWASLLATGAALFGPAPWWPAVPGGDARTPLGPGSPAGRSRPGPGRRVGRRCSRTPAWQFCVT